jgi:tetratricopeptide (TPR) repeat protein
MARDEVGRMTGAMLALREPPADFVDFLDAKSEGNPFFVAEYLRLAVAEHVLERDARGCWGIADSGAGGAAAYSDLPLPQSQRQMVELRLGRVSPASQAVLHAAAVMGRVFDLEILRRVLDMEDQHLLDALDEMIRRQILEPGEDGGFRFIHDKLHEIAAARLGEAERRSLHERVALAIEARYSGDPALEPLRAALGLHWSKAGVPEKAAPELLAAADRAQAFNAVDEAIQRYRAAFGEIRAVCSGEPEDQNRWRVLAAEVCEKLGDVLALTGAHAAARDAYDEAVGQLPDGEPGGIEVHIARLHRKAGKTWEIQHAHEEALDAYALADEHLEQVTEARRDRAWRQEWIQVALNRIWVHYWRVKVAEMDAELARVGPFVAEHGLPLHRYHYFMSIVLRDYRQDRYRVSERTLEDGRRMLAAAQESGAQAETAFADFVLGFGLLFAGQLDEAEAHLSRALESCRRIGDASGEIRACAYLVLCHRRQGRVEETREAARELLTLAGAQQMRDYLGVAQACLGWAAFRSGDQRSAREQSKQALATWKELSFPYPFQWSAALILLRAQMSRAPLGPLVDLAGLMRQPEQMHLPDAIDRGLEQAIAARASGDHDRVRAGLADAMAAAERDGFM